MPIICITFDHPNGVYNSGETLNGTVELRTNTSETIRGVSIKINGYAQVRWSEDRGSRNGVKRTEDFSAYDEYLNVVNYVIGSDGGLPIDLAPGTYNHSFSCVLPSSLPTSCQEEFGDIKYEVIVTTDLPYMFDNVFKQGFTVIQPLNLNLEPTLKVPRVVESFEFPCCCSCCCGCGEIKGELTIPFGGYVPGQKIQYQMFVFNNTDKDLQNAKVELEKCIVFESQKPMRKKRSSTTTIYSKIFSPILRLQRKEYIDSIQLPAIPPTTTSSEECVRIEYLLTGKVMTGCCANNIDLVIPVKIGTVPIIESCTSVDNVITMQPTLPTAPSIDQTAIIATSTSSDSPPAYLSEAPPSYEMPFIPKYPVYQSLPTEPPNTENPTTSLPDYDWSV